MIQRGLGLGASGWDVRTILRLISLVQELLRVSPFVTFGPHTRSQDIFCCQAREGEREREHVEKPQELISPAWHNRTPADWQMHALVTGRRSALFSQPLLKAVRDK